MTAHSHLHPSPSTSATSASSTSSTKAKGEKLAWRLSHILARLHHGDVIDKHQLAQDFEVDVRTIERDLGERLKGISCWTYTHEQSWVGAWALECKPAWCWMR